MFKIRLLSTILVLLIPLHSTGLAGQEKEGVINNHPMKVANSSPDLLPKLFDIGQKLPVGQIKPHDGPPEAILNGPKERNPGSLIIISAKGTKGSNFRFDCFPKNSDWMAVKFYSSTAGEEDFGIVFSTDVEGTYYFVMAVANSKGDLALATHVVKVGKGGPGPDPGPGPKPPPPDPPPPTDPFFKAMSDGYTTDLAAGVGTKQQKSDLAAVYKAAATITTQDKTLTKVTQVFDVMRAAAKQKGIPDGALPGLRDAIQAQIKVWLPNLTTSTPLTDQTRKDLQEKLGIVASNLEKLN